MLSFVIAGMLFAVSPAARGEVPDYISLRDSFSRQIEQRLDDSGIAGLSLALVDQGSVVWSQGFGFSDRETDTRTTAHTQFRIGSITKLITALATLQLEEDGLIDIDQPLSAYLERFLMRSRFSDDGPITVRSILTHHSGIPTDLLKGQWSSHDFSSVVEQLRNEYVSYPPEFVLSYSNVAFSLLGSMIEEVAQQPYESFVQERIAMPLQMHNSGFHHSRFTTGMSKAYAADGSPQSLLPIRDLPALGMYSTAADLARFITLFTNRERTAHRKLLSDAAISEMLAHQNGDIELDFDDKIGLGWLLDRCGIQDSGTIAEHGGTTIYFSGRMMIATEHQLGVVVMANTQGARDTVNQIAEALLRAAIDLKQQPGPTLVNLENSIPPMAGKSSRNNGGDYLTRLGMVSINPMEHRLCACSRKQVLDLVPQPDGWFNLEKNKPGSKNDDPARVTEITIGDQQVMVMHYEGRTQRFGSRMPEQGIPETWRQRLGHYRIINGDANFTVDHVSLLEQDQRLYLSYRLPQLSAQDIHTPLTPITATEAVTVGLGRTRGETVQVDRFDDSDREYLVFSGLIAEKVSE